MTLRSILATHPTASALWTPRRHFHCAGSGRRWLSTFVASARHATQTAQIVEQESELADALEQLAVATPAAPPVAVGGMTSTRRRGRKTRDEAAIASLESSSSDEEELLAFEEQQQPSARSTRGSAHASSDVNSASDSGAPGDLSNPHSGSSSSNSENMGDNKVVTQTIFKLERRGEGWGEEIFPHITVEQVCGQGLQQAERCGRGVRRQMCCLLWS